MIAIRSLSIDQGDFRLRDLSFTIPSGGYGVLMGRSGSGKTTVLEAICGLRDTCAGEILIDDQTVTFLPPGARGLGYVPQDRALFPFLPVRNQIAYGLQIRRLPAARIRARVEELAGLLDIAPLLSRPPEHLSGGEAQRVALARALAPWPRALCLDEPLSALDSELHGEITGLLKHIHHETGITVLHITHNASEATALATHHFRIHDGTLTSEDPPA